MSAHLLSFGDNYCTLLPDVGGSLGGWRVGGQEMLRVASAADIAARAPLGMASFPLVPYSNRIADGRFVWSGTTIQLTRNFAPEPHAIHGVGWTTAWQLTALAENCATLTLAHTADAQWPWSFVATQTITLTDHQLQLDLAVKNTAPAPAPLAFGHHPYFDQEGAALHFHATKMWLADAHGLPAAQVDVAGGFDFNSCTPVAGHCVDHCYTGGNGAARISWAARALALEIETTPAMPAAVVYIPDGADAFCWEPVPHVNNALNMPGALPAMPIVAAGATLSSVLLLRAVGNPT